MNRTGLIVALAIAVVSGLVFGLFPQLELWVARYFHGFVESGVNYFAFRIYPPLMITRDIALWIPTLLIIPPVVALVIKLILPRRRMLVPGRAVLFLTVTLALGPGLLVNTLLKDHWGRPRPVDIIQFGGEHHFVAWWDPRGDCDSNCSFVSGDVSGAFWTIAPAALAPPQWRALAYGAALALGTGMGVLRVMAGGHFISDVIFAGVFVFLIIWLTHGLIYRWPRTRLTDEGVERAIARCSLTGTIAALRVGHRVADEVAGPESDQIADDSDPHLRRRRRGWW
jgi:membrane-associated PAP2 superfamily phosphatase